MRTARWFILIFLQATAVAWAYTSVTHLLATSPNQHDLAAQYGATSQPMSLALQQINREQAAWGRQSLFSVAVCFLVAIFVLINWVNDRPPHGGDEV
jgi:predicted lysophospholipase L1 biosynthesis ABC-type transport system permease subunit